MSSNSQPTNQTPATNAVTPTSPLVTAIGAVASTSNTTDNLSDDIEIVLKGKKSECCVCLDTLTLPIKLSCGHYVCFLCIKGVTQTNVYSCPKCQTDFDDDDLIQFVDANEVDQKVPVWQYSRTDKDNWWIFDPKTNLKVEELYNNFLNDPDYEIDDNPVTIGVTEYYYDFGKLLQKSQHGKIRKIKREVMLDSKKVRGVAGLKFI
jgi:hypothetical protein